MAESLYFDTDMSAEFENPSEMIDLLMEQTDAANNIPLDSRRSSSTNTNNSSVVSASTSPEWINEMQEFSPFATPTSTSTITAGWVSGGSQWGSQPQPLAIRREEPHRLIPEETQTAEMLLDRVGFYVDEAKRLEDLLITRKDHPLNASQNIQVEQQQPQALRRYPVGVLFQPQEQQTLISIMERNTVQRFESRTSTNGQRPQQIFESQPIFSSQPVQNAMVQARTQQVQMIPTGPVTSPGYPLSTQTLPTSERVVTASDYLISKSDPLLSMSAYPSTTVSYRPSTPQEQNNFSSGSAESLHQYRYSVGNLVQPMSVIPHNQTSSSGFSAQTTASSVGQPLSSVPKPKRKYTKRQTSVNQVPSEERVKRKYVRKLPYNKPRGQRKNEANVSPQPTAELEQINLDQFSSLNFIH